MPRQSGPPARDPFREGMFHEWLGKTFPAGPDVVVGIGDDAALLRWRRKTLVAKVDSVVEGIHFAAGTPPRLAGAKAANRALSDVAAMGGVPQFALLAIAVPRRWTAASVQGFVSGCAGALRRFEASLVGGDASDTPGPFTASVFLLAGCGARGPLLRSGARSGDLLWATGEFGGSPLGRHLSFVPRVREALAVGRRSPVHAATDVSDGLSLDLHRMCRSSGVGAILYEERIPISAAARRLARHTGRAAIDHALGDGEDYELLLALPRASEPRVAAMRLGAGLRVIGRFGGTRVLLRGPDGRDRELPPTGWRHGFPR